jgi:hypothetical protein
MVLEFKEHEDSLEIVLHGTKEGFLEKFPDLNATEPFDLLEHEKLIGNDWHDITGRIGLTEAPAIGVASFMPDGAEEHNDEEEDFERAYFYADYMITNPWEKLSDEGRVFFKKIV